MNNSWLRCLIGVFVLLNAPLFSSYIQNNSITFYSIIAVNSLLALMMIYTYKQASLGSFEVNPGRSLPLLIQGSVQLSLYYYVIIVSNLITIDWLSATGMPAICSLRMPFVFYQIIFAFVCDYLLTIFRGMNYKPQFYVIPLVLSINLFLWILNDYAILHLVIIVVGIFIKTFVTRTEADGRSIHIFNPSFIVLTLVSLIVIALGLNGATPDLRTSELASMFELAPNFNIFLFCVGCITLWLPNSYLVSIGAYSSVMFLDYLSQWFFGYQLFGGLVRGSVFIAVMLGITDPQTSPRSSCGKFIFGVAYGLTLTLFNFIFFFFNPIDAYFSKILAIPVLNIFSRRFDTYFASIAYLNFGYYSSRLIAILLFSIIFIVTYAQLTLNNYTLAEAVALKIRLALGLSPFL